MPRDLHVHFLPDGLSELQLEASIAVVIDVFRASTTIVHALAAGAAAIVPCADVSEALAAAAHLPPAAVLLGGERDGVLIEGFNLHNSPFSYTRHAVEDKTIVFTTTNGTRALKKCSRAERILVGACVNTGAVIRELVDDKRPVHLVCAGTRGEVTAEDVICAGALANGLCHADSDARLSGDETAAAIEMYESSRKNPVKLYETLRNSPGGRDLVRLGFERDIRRSLEWDLFDLVPRYDPAGGKITANRG